MSDSDREQQRLDQWLWYARFFKTRSQATKLCRGRRVRVDGNVQSKASGLVRPGNVLTFPQGNRIRVIRVEEIGARRGPALEAQALYFDLTPSEMAAEVSDKGPRTGRVGKRPTKALRRALDRFLGRIRKS